MTDIDKWVCSLKNDLNSAWTYWLQHSPTWMYAVCRRLLRHKVWLRLVAPAWCLPNLLWSSMHSAANTGNAGERISSCPHGLVSSYLAALNLLIFALPWKEESLWTKCSTRENLAQWTWFQAENVCFQTSAERAFFCRSPR